MTGIGRYNVYITRREADVTQHQHLPTRRSAIATALAATAIATGAGAAPQPRGPTMSDQITLTDHTHDWDWLVGQWNVRHRRLKARRAERTFRAEKP